MKYWVIVAAYLAAMVFALVGPWLADAVGMIVVEMALNDGQGATVLDHLALLLLYVLITPFVFVMDFDSPPRILFALNGACWACAIWALLLAWRSIRHRIAGRPKS